MTPATRRLFAVARTLHIYLTIVGLAILLFFAGTGFMLNHPDWFGVDAVRYQDVTGSLPVDWLDPVDDLRIVEALREEHGVRGAVRQFDVDDAEVRITFRRPGHYLADAVIDRSTGDLTMTIESRGVAALLADLHRGSETGPTWSLLAIDAAAALLLAVSVTGFIMLLILPKYRRHALVGFVASTAAAAILYTVAVP